MIEWIECDKHNENKSLNRWKKNFLFDEFYALCHYWLKELRVDGIVNFLGIIPLLLLGVNHRWRSRFMGETLEVFSNYGNFEISIGKFRTLNKLEILMKIYQNFVASPKNSLFNRRHFKTTSQSQNGPIPKFSKNWGLKSITQKHNWVKSLLRMTNQL